MNMTLTYEERTALRQANLIEAVAHLTSDDILSTLKAEFESRIAEDLTNPQPVMAVWYQSIVDAITPFVLK